MLLETQQLLTRANKAPDRLPKSFSLTSDGKQVDHPTLGSGYHQQERRVQMSNGNVWLIVEDSFATPTARMIRQVFRNIDDTSSHVTGTCKGEYPAISFTDYRLCASPDVVRGRKIDNGSYFSISHAELFSAVYNNHGRLALIDMQLEPYPQIYFNLQSREITIPSLHYSSTIPSRRVSFSTPYFENIAYTITSHPRRTIIGMQELGDNSDKVRGDRKRRNFDKTLATVVVPTKVLIAELAIVLGKDNKDWLNAQDWLGVGIHVPSWASKARTGMLRA